MNHFCSFLLPVSILALSSSNRVTEMIRKLETRFSCARSTFVTSYSQDFAFLNCCYKLCNSSSSYSKASFLQIILNFAILQYRGTIWHLLCHSGLFYTQQRDIVDSEASIIYELPPVLPPPCLQFSITES